MNIRKLSVILCLFCGVFTSVAIADGVEGTTVRPMQEEAEVKGCTIAQTGDHKVRVGDLIELNYTYPVVPVTLPKKVSHKQTLTGAVAKSPLGFRGVATGAVGTGTLVFYFEAKKEGEDIVTLLIDGVEYRYKFEVVKKQI